jgi:hypothetical protein
MPKAMELIVAAYVRFNRGASLEILRSHRQKLKLDIQSRPTDFDYGRILEQIHEDLAFIDAGLEQLRGRVVGEVGVPSESGLSAALRED